MDTAFTLMMLFYSAIQLPQKLSSIVYVFLLPFTGFHVYTEQHKKETTFTAIARHNVHT